jgi:ligand-binding SRPBCC domain-containing protein
MVVHVLKTVQRIPTDLATAWDFFSDPANLQSITPASLGFNIISTHHGKQMYAGQVIEYRVRPLFNIPIYWMTEITHVSAEKKYFVDEQRFGPYALWHHQHHFAEIAGGIEMTDIVHYKIPYWFFGEIAHRLFVKKQLRQIFIHRFKTVETLYGPWPGGQSMQIDMR